jgi:serine/threonine protein kinase
MPSNASDARPPTLAAVFHPFIVDFYSAGEINGSEYIEMEYVAGGTLKGFVPKL